MVYFYEMAKGEYRPRLIDSRIEESLKVFGALCIEGPKWCGKTWSSRHHAESSFYLGDPQGGFQNRALAELNPSLVLQGSQPRLLDEWQEVPSLWDAVRHQVDQTRQKGQFILTGSATPPQKGVMHSGAGRIASLRMRPMSLYESGDSSGGVSLKALFSGEFQDQMIPPPELHQILEFIVRGGWPGSLGLNLKQAAMVPREYLNAIVHHDLFRLDGGRRDTGKMKLLLQSLARNESTTASQKRLRDDIRERDDQEIDGNTVSTYLDLFSRLFLTDNQPPFAPAVRSRLRVKQSEKRHFCDPSLAAALLNVGVPQLMGDLKTAGFLFEALCERDLNIYAEAMGGRLFHYQDYANNEIDAVVQQEDGSWGAFEIKLGAHQVDGAAEHLVKLQKRMENPDEPNSAPKVLCVLTGLSHAAYRRADGVYVIPITALGP